MPIMIPYSSKLPLEIYEKIIDILGDNCDAVFNCEEKAAVQQCALTCKTFLQLARPHLFRAISEAVGFHRQPGARLIRLADIIRYAPIISTYVHDLYVDMFEFNWNDIIPDSEIERCGEVLLTFTNLEVLDISYTDSHEVVHAPGYDATCSPRLPENIANVCSRILHTYTEGKGQLKSLVIDDLRIRDIPYNSIFTCPTLRSVRLLNTDRDPKLTADAPGIQNLMLEGTTGKDWIIPVSILSRFTGLEDLLIQPVSFLYDVEDNLIPTFKIKTLSIETNWVSGSAWQLFSYLRKINREEFKPISYLESLNMELNHPEDVAIFTNSFFSDLPLLKDLYINIEDETENAGFSFRDFQFDQFIPPKLNQMSFLFWLFSDDAIEQPLLISFLTMLDYIPRGHHFKNLDVHWKTVIDITFGPSPRDWYSAEIYSAPSALLNQCSSFTNLHDLRFTLEFIGVTRKHTDLPPAEKLEGDLRDRVQEVEKDSPFRLEIKRVVSDDESPDTQSPSARAFINCIRKPTAVARN